MQFRSLGWEDPLEEGMATHSSILAWRIPWTEEPGWLQSMGLCGVRHNWSVLACTYASPISSYPLSTQKQEDLRLVMGRKDTGRLGKENQRLLEGCSGCSSPTWEPVNEQFLHQRRGSARNVGWRGQNIKGVHGVRTRSSSGSLEHGEKRRRKDELEL